MAGFSFPFHRPWACSWLDQTYGYMPSRIASPSVDRHQIILHGDSGIRVWTTCPESLRVRAPTGSRTRDLLIPPGRHSTSCVTRTSRLITQVQLENGSGVVCPQTSRSQKVTNTFPRNFRRDRPCGDKQSSEFSRWSPYVCSCYMLIVDMRNFFTSFNTGQL